jgi:hypothetical protein
MVQCSQLLVTIHFFALFLHWQSTWGKVGKNEIEYVKWSMYVKQSTQNEIEYVKWSTYIKILVGIANYML